MAEQLRIVLVAAVFAYPIVAQLPPGAQYQVTTLPPAAGAVAIPPRNAPNDDVTS